MTFGDYEPEDAWHPDDSVLEQARNLAKRIALVDHLAATKGTSPGPMLAAIRHRYELALRRRNLSDRDRLRLAQLGDDLELAEGRL